MRHSNRSVQRSPADAGLAALGAAVVGLIAFEWVAPRRYVSVGAAQESIEASAQESTEEPGSAAATTEASNAAREASTESERESAIESAVEAFRNGDFSAALGLFDQALEKEPPHASGRIHYNRGSCLLELGELEQAKRAFEAAASRDPELRVLAMLRVAEIHHALGEYEDARSILRSTKEASSARPELAKLWAAIDEELRVVNQSPAREAVPGETESTARHTGPWSAGLLVEMGGGYDSNAFQVGLSGTAGLITGLSPEGSGYGSTTVAATLYRTLNARSEWELGYGISQLVYPQERFDELSLQIQTLNTGLYYELSPKVAVRSELLGSLVFAGLRSFDAADLEGGLRLSVHLFPHDRWQTDVALSALGVLNLGDAFAFLRGHRVRADIRELYRWGEQPTRGSVEVGVGYRAYTQGTQRDSTEPSTESEVVERLCAGRCTPFLGIPLAYDAPTAHLRLGLTLWEQVHLSMGTELGWRLYRGSVSEGWVTPSDVVIRTGEARRRDIRLTTSAEASARIVPDAFLDLRYTFTLNASSLSDTDFGTTGNLADYDFRAHTISLFLRWEPKLGPFG